MSGETKTPVLRFPDSAPWEVHPLGELANLYQPQTIGGSLFTKTGYTVYGANGPIGFYSRFNHEESQIIISCRGTCGTVNKTAPRSWINGNAMVVAPKPGKKLDKDFLLNVLKQTDFTPCILGSSQPQITRGPLSEVGIALAPTITEQQSIGGFFRELDALIAEREKALGKLESLKKAMLEKMFPQGDAKVPEVRFKGFEGEWEEKKFETAASRKSSLCDDLDLPRLEYEDVVSFCGVLNKNIFQKQSTKTGIPFSTGNVLFGKLRPYLGNWFLPEFDGLAVGDWWVLQPKTLDPAFLFSFIQTNSFQEIANQSTGSKMPRADWNLVSNSVFLFPSLPEQQEIGSFFRSLDALLAARREEAEKLKQLKKAFLERMFA